MTKFFEDLKKLEKIADQATQDLRQAQTEPQRKYALMMANRADLAVHMLRSGFGAEAAFKVVKFGA